MKNKILILDFNNFVYRAFYAIPVPLTNSKGEPVKVVLGFMNMLYKLVIALEPKSIIVVTDSPSSWRKIEYKEYKSQRAKMPDEMKVQIPVLREVLSLMNIPLYEVAGYEADDVIATLAKKIQEEVLIASTDKDLCQLINKKVSLYDPQKMKLIEKDQVHEKYGIWPEQMIDYLCLVGDKSDNIPGIPGVGEKTAAKLLNEFGSLDNILNNLDKVKQKEKFLSNLELLKITKKLVILNQDLGVNVIINSIKYKDPAFFLKLEEIEVPSVIKKFQDI